MKQRATNDAKGKNSEIGRISLLFGRTEAHTDDDRDRPENEDAHFIKPNSTDKVLEAALRMTRVHYMNLTGIFTLSPPSSGYNMAQWRFIQDQLNVPCITAGLSRDPLRLFILGSWSSGLENWKYPDE